MNIAIIIAGGSGQRMKQDVPKQFLIVDDRFVIIHTLENFQKSEFIDKIYVSCITGWENILNSYAKQFNITKLEGIVSGGESRSVSIYNVLNHIRNTANDDDVIIVFDSIRPIISNDMLDDSIKQCMIYGASCGARPCYETMFRSGYESNIISKSEDRDTLYIGTGPEAALYKLAVNAFDTYIKTDPSLTMIEMLLKMNVKVALSKSDSKCIKLTTKEDVDIFKALLKIEKCDWLK